MEKDIYGKCLVKVIKFLLDNKGRWITDYEITNIAPLYGKKIIEDLIAYDVVITTKDGILFDDDCFEALKSYLSKFGVNID
jgi:hypothetical protein